MQRIKLKEPQLSRAEFNRRADEFLKRIQEELMPDHAAEIVAINMMTGEYVLAPTSGQAFEAYRARWPDILMFLCRVDGGPSTKFHGR
jgi:hypothetical protein